MDQAREFIKEIRDEFDDASHNVPAFIIGHGASIIEHCTDDGEPSGTAGRPMLHVLKGSGLGDVVVVVTRYFGGTKLGKGGLVRAYGDSVKAVLEITPLAHKVPTSTALITVPYHLFERVQLLIPNHNGNILEKTFEVDVTLTVQFPTVNVEDFQKELTSLSHGQVEAIIIESNNDTIMPILTT